MSMDFSECNLGCAALPLHLFALSFAWVGMLLLGSRQVLIFPELYAYS